MKLFQGISVFCDAFRKHPAWIKLGCQHICWAANIRCQFYRVVGVALGEQCVEHPDELAAQGDERLFLFQWILASGGV